MTDYLDYNGLSLCTRYCYPPNSLSLCGPAKQKELSWYTQTGISDPGTLDIISQFSTLYPYLSFIAYENKIRDPLDAKVVEAYWLGNSFLNNISARHFAGFLRDKLSLKKKLPSKKLNQILTSLEELVIPSHVFHVTNVYLRTGHLDIPYTVETMNACLINWGKVIKISNKNLSVITRPLKLINDKLAFGANVIRKIIFQGEKDGLVSQIKAGDIVSYHWGFFCQKIDNRQLNNLKYYTHLALKLANIPSSRARQLADRGIFQRW